jgi:glyoxylase-like metal-dependent hydrolase (beta-lactamase superfamily II)
MQIEQLAPDLFIAIGETYHANSTVFIRGDDALLIDGMASAADATELRRLLEDELQKRVRFIISTHYFSDHIAALRLFPGAEIIAHELYAQTFQTERYRTAEEVAHFVEPTMVIGDRMRMRWGRFTLDLFHNPGHTMSTLGIDVPEADLLFVGDTIVGNLVYLAYSAPELVAIALDRLARRGRGWIVASHGGTVPSAAIGHARHYLGRLTAGEVALESCLPPGVIGTDFERIFHERNLATLEERLARPAS